MNTSTAVVLLGMTVLVIVAIGMAYRLRRIDIVDIHIIMFAAYFFLYATIDATVNNLQGYNIVWVSILYGSIFLTIMFVWISPHIIFNNYMSELRVQHLIEIWGKVDELKIIWLLTYSSCVILIGAMLGGMIGNINYDRLKDANIILPYWYKVATFFVKPALFISFLGLTAKLIKLGRRHRWLVLTMMAWCLILTAIYGRRAIFTLMAMGGVSAIVYWKGSWINFIVKNSHFIIGVIALFLIYSNGFQYVRSSLEDISEPRSYDNPISREAIDLSNTLDNLKSRMAMWRFNYLVVSHEECCNSPGAGTLFLQAIKNSIPSFAANGKEYRDLDFMVADFYDLPRRDYPGNTMAFLQADVGYLSSLLYIAQMLTIVGTAIIIVRCFRIYPFMCLMLIGRVLYYLVNIENNYADLLSLYRDLGLFIAIFQSIRWARRLVLFSRPNKRRS